MLSYRHAFHAGNHADVLKHLVLMLALERLVLKLKPLCFVDTHAGAGSYRLDTGLACKNQEYERGISRLMAATELPAPLHRFVELICSFSPGPTLSEYPGSPALARALLRPDDRLELSELHPADFEGLGTWACGARHIHLSRTDGFARLKALMPPRERRGLVLIDPPYEIKKDYLQVVEAVRGAQRRFATGVFLVWYPLLGRAELEFMRKGLMALDGAQLWVELQVASPTGRGMFGSGMWVLNPPWQLQEQLGQCAGALTRLLGEDHSAELRLRAHEPDGAIR